MMRLPTGRAGVTLVELLIATMLSMLAFVALISLASTAARHQVSGGKKLTAQMNASVAFKAIERAMSEATYLAKPSVGGASPVLEVCTNAEKLLASPSRIDSSKDMRSFAFCPDPIKKGILHYYHSLPSCPPVYTCGTGSSLSFGDVAHPVVALFTRPSANSMAVEVSLTSGLEDAKSGERPSLRISSFVIAADAGINQ